MDENANHPYNRKTRQKRAAPHSGHAGQTAKHRMAENSRNAYAATVLG
jgi:hypothetical protein